jgi:hypothetical protein
VNVNENPNKPVATKQQLDSAKKVIAASPYIPNKAKKEIAKDIDKQKNSKKEDVQDSADLRGPNKWFHPISKDTSYAQYLTKQKKLPDAEQDNFLEFIWNKKAFAYKEKYGPGAREQFIEDLKHNTPKMMFLLLPLVALILRVAFWKNKKFYVEHLIYTFHLFCFLFLFLGITILLKMLIPQSWTVVTGIINFFEVVYICWYVWRSLRVVYQRSRFRTVTKVIGISLMYFLAFTFCISALFILTTIF